MQTVNFVNSILTNNDLPMMTADEDDPTFYKTNLMLGSCNFNIFYSTTTVNEIQLVASLVALPKENILPLYRFLLERNVALWGNFSFCVNEGFVLGVESIDNVSKLSPEEFMAKVNKFGRTADKYDDEISSRFGAEHLGYQAGLE